MSSKQEQKRKEIYEFYLANRSRGKPFTLEHFNHVNITRRGIYKILERADNESGHKRVRGSGRVAKIMTPVAIKRLKTMFDHSDRVSTRQAARKFGYTHSHIIKTLASPAVSQSTNSSTRRIVSRKDLCLSSTHIMPMAIMYFGRTLRHRITPNPWSTASRPKRSILSKKLTTRQPFQNVAQSRTFGVFWKAKCTRVTGKQKAWSS